MTTTKVLSTSNLAAQIDEFKTEYLHELAELYDSPLSDDEPTRLRWTVTATMLQLTPRTVVVSLSGSPNFR